MSTTGDNKDSKRYVGDGLSFALLRDANLKRLPRFKNKHGKPAHSQPDGSDWSPAQWIQALMGELGEYANKRKKYERGDLTFEEFAVEARKELADVQIYLDLLALRCLDARESFGGGLDDGCIGLNTHEFNAVTGALVHPTGVDLGQAVIDKWNETSVAVDCNLYMDVNGWHYIDPAKERGGSKWREAP